MPKIVTISFLEFAKYISTDRLKFCFFCLHYTYSNSVSDFKCGVTYQWIQLFLKTFSFLNGHCVITNWSLPLVVIKDEWLWRKFQCSCGRSNNIVGTRLQLEIIQSFCFKLCPKYGPDCSQKWNIANERTRFSCQCNSTCEGSLGCVLLPRRVKKKTTTSGKFDKRFERLCKANQWRYLVENVKTEGFLTHVNWSVAETTGT